MDVGHRHLDCPPIYGNEAEIGAALKEVFEKERSLVQRKDLVLTSKL